MDRAPLIRIFEQRLDLRCKRQPAIVQAVIQRLDADPIAHQPQLAPAAVPKRKGEHASQPVDEIDAPLLEPMEQDFGVGMIRLEPMPATRDQLGAKLRVIVDFAVEDDPQRRVFAAHRLRSRRSGVDDRQPAMPKADAAVGVDPGGCAVRAPVLHRLAHACDEGLGDPERASIERQHACDSTHYACSRPGCWRSARNASNTDDTRSPVSQSSGPSANM